MANSKLKILLFGEVADQAAPFCVKLKALNASKAGPFDAAFCVGPCSLTALLEQDFPIPLYLQQVATADSELVEDIISKADAIAKDDQEDTTDELQSCLSLGKNIFYLRDAKNVSAAGIWRISVTTKKPEIVVACCPARFLSDGPAAVPLKDSLKHVSYTGCDLLLTSEWPQGIEQVLPGTEETNVSFDVANIALAARARYHAVPAATFQQSPPFQHLSAATSTVKVQHTGRFLGLSAVKTAAEAKAVGKPGKFVHALSLTPLHSCSAVELQGQKAEEAAACPFTDDSYQHDGGASHSASAQQSGLSEASARRILAEERSKQTGTTAHRWNITNKRRRKDDNDTEPVEVDPSMKTLFVHGLHKDVTGRMQTLAGDPVLWKFFEPHGITLIRRPPGAPTSAFCFLDFESHKAATACLEEMSGNAVVDGVDLDIRWGTQKKKDGKEHPNKRQRLTEAEARDSSVLFFRWLATQPEDERTQENAEMLRKWMETTLEDALAGEDDEKVTAESEPALQVKVTVPDAEDMHFGFLEFASHAAASMAVATITGSTDGGIITQETKGRPDSLVGVAMHWSHGPKEKKDDVVEDASGFRFERKHFPADSRKDCWFCLASKGCEKHLITGVFDTCYAAMPKGPVHQGHVLLVPVEHSNKGVLHDPIVSLELDDIKKKLRQHASSVYDNDLFVFERAIQTKHGYHTHVQCIPVQRKLGLELQTTLLAQAQKAGMDLREINSDLGLSALLNSDDENDGGYFYAEIPVTGTEFKRYLYKVHPGSRNVPLQLGREVVAAVLKKPELAHWKSCVLDKEQETEIAAALRKSLEEA
jgi:diadenosine tetraphosphate (Ap4A) HIT family hydrolase